MADAAVGKSEGRRAVENSSNFEVVRGGDGRFDYVSPIGRSPVSIKKVQLNKIGRSRRIHEGARQKNEQLP